MRKRCFLATTSGMVLLAGTAHGAETINYTYDAQGRVVKAEHSGTVNDDVKTEYEHDDVDNRTRKKVTGADT